MQTPKEKLQYFLYADVSFNNKNSTITIPIRKLYAYEHEHCQLHIWFY